MEKLRIKRWRVVYGIGDMTGVRFLEAVDEVAASYIVKHDLRKMTDRPVIYSVTEDKKS